MRKAITAVKIPASSLFVLDAPDEAPPTLIPTRRLPNLNSKFPILAYPSNSRSCPLDALRLTYPVQRHNSSILLLRQDRPPQGHAGHSSQLHRAAHPRLQSPSAPLPHLRHTLHPDVPHRHRAPHILYATARWPHRVHRAGFEVESFLKVHVRFR